MDYYPHHIGDFNSGAKRQELPVVYALATRDLGLIKIGMSISFKQRFINIQTACPYELDLWIAIRTPKPRQIEAHLHRRMRHCNTRGEWFKPEDGDLDDLINFFALTNLNVGEVSRALL